MTRRLAGQNVQRIETSPGLSIYPRQCRITDENEPFQAQIWRRVTKDRFKGKIVLVACRGIGPQLRRVYK
jgi:hypothetical protein